ncbi:1-acyl-sn-glycerol-3-phosphate acyltransferase [Methylonatrum kenyense]|uniref:lysophospholipid acyltransferase family protein n=1 Tax=Methylonatrum kenyense TaxID=455253 RepID=UPI0020BF8922|nr:lysophospholipid acyltransferase family protein [Methylonatrum kenyense]MCK8515263.1 1-acyl-sn-glycerol-3-phosphate acyltransferase [Methylonatrum kenyense]
MADSPSNPGQPVIRSTRIILGSILWAAGTLAATLVFGTLGILLAALSPYRMRYRLFNLWSRFLIWWAAVAAGVRFEVEGLENRPDTPCIVLAKHQSAWETLALMDLFQPQTWVLKRELTRIPFIGWAIRMLKPIAIDRSARKEAMQQMLEQGRARLDEGVWVVIYPEGTRVPPGRSGRYQRGGAVLAVETGYPVVLVAHNAGECWPKNSFLKYPGTIRVRISQVIESKGKTQESLLAEARDWIERNSREVAQAYEDRTAGKQGK